MSCRVNTGGTGGHNEWALTLFHVFAFNVAGPDAREFCCKKFWIAGMIFELIWHAPFCNFQSCRQIFCNFQFFNVCVVPNASILSFPTPFENKNGGIVAALIFPWLFLHWELLRCGSDMGASRAKAADKKTAAQPKTNKNFRKSKGQRAKICAGPCCGPS